MASIPTPVLMLLIIFMWFSIPAALIFNGYFGLAWAGVIVALDMIYGPMVRTKPSGER